MPDAQTHAAQTAVPGPPPGDRSVHSGNRDAWVIALQGVIDADAVSRLQRQVSDALTGYDRVVIDLRDVSVLGTPALALLCGALRRTHRPHTTIVIAGASPPARHALAVCEIPGVELAAATPSPHRHSPVDESQHATTRY